MTLIELAVVLAIVAILAAMAWPAFQDSIRKGRRSDAMAALAQAMQAQERMRSNASEYEKTMGGLRLPNTSPKGYYALSVLSADASTYRLEAAAVAGQPQAQDSQCNRFFAEMRNGQILYSSASSAGTVNASPDPCWVQ